MKRGRQKREKSGLSAKGMLKEVKKSFEAVHVETSGKGRPRDITEIDCLMSAVAMFAMKSPSLLCFDRFVRGKPIVEHNLKTLYEVVQAPSDTRMREILDNVNPRDLRCGFLALFESVQRGQLLKDYQFLGSYLVAIDGTGAFESDKVHCANCCEKHHRDGRISYYHNVLAGAIIHPNKKQVIPLCPEPIFKHDGSVKNDCEQNAAHRFLEDLKAEHPRLKLTILSDALHATAPHVNYLNSLDYHFILNIKPGSHSSLFEWVSGLKLETTTITHGKNIYNFRFINSVPLNGTEESPEINFLECKALEIDGKQTKERFFTWATNHTITKKNIYDLMRAGRARWKIENETFNTLKTQGYQFEHNFGHGKKNLNTVFAMLMFLAFLIDQVQEAACGLFQAALAKSHARKYLWETMRVFFERIFIPSWEAFFLAIIGDKNVQLTFDST